MNDITITRHDAGGSGEYHAHVPGSDHIGRLIWTSDNGGTGDNDVRIATSTQVPPEIGGRGVAGILVEALIADAQAQSFTIRPDCSYVEKAFAKHPEWAALKA